VDQVSASDRLIAPEILDDAFYEALKGLGMFEDLEHVLEIGSSSGEGSTRALVSTLRLNRHNPVLYCMEVSRARFAELQRAYQKYDFVRCYNMSSVPSSHVASEEEIRVFYDTHRTALNQYDLATIFGWRAEGLQYLQEHPELDRDGIAQIKKANGIEHFDLVLIDGSEFTGSAELDEVYGAKIICLDDTNAFKCYAARQRLMSDPLYENLADDQTLRNGYSIFCRTDAWGHWRTAKANAIEALRRAQESSRRRKLVTRAKRIGRRVLNTIRGRS
jgi:hypothetical protein